MMEWSITNLRDNLADECLLRRSVVEVSVVANDISTVVTREVNPLSTSFSLLLFKPDHSSCETAPFHFGKGGRSVS